MQSEARPLARSQGLIVEEVGDELLIYDQQAERAHGLSVAAAQVWRRCDGKTSVDMLGAELDLDSDTVSRALNELAASELLEMPETASESAPAYTRRELTLKLAKVGTAVATTSLIVSVYAPTPAMAATAAFCLGISAAGCCGGAAGCCNQSIGCCCCNPACDSTGCPNCAGFPSGTKLCVPIGPGSDAQCRRLCGPGSDAKGCENCPPSC